MLGAVRSVFAGTGYLGRPGCSERIHGHLWGLRPRGVWLGSRPRHDRLSLPQPIPWTRAGATEPRGARCQILELNTVGHETILNCFRLSRPILCGRAYR